MFWNELESRCNQIQRKSPTYIIGDFNARLYGRQISEHDIMGPFIFGPGTLALPQMSTNMMENRQNLIDFCKFNGYILSYLVPLLTNQLVSNVRTNLQPQMDL